MTSYTVAFFDATDFVPLLISFNEGVCQLSFCEARNRSHNAKGKIVQCYKDQIDKKIFREVYTTTPNEEFPMLFPNRKSYCQMCCCNVNPCSGNFLKNEVSDHCYSCLCLILAPTQGYQDFFQCRNGFYNNSKSIFKLL